ncbi:ATP-binding protein [Pleurocapsales cyanobacterium LEGE 10410]|nr:ATP-binding protein [Pleurocapsales cyanobacterium LEGE 10410]
MNKLVDFESVLSLIDKSISPTYLSPTQEIVLREVWNGKTYSEMACQHNYDPEYIKGVGSNLWQTLSRTFDKQINKSNFVPFMRQKVASLFDEKYSQPESNQIEIATANIQEKHQYLHWTTAPTTKFFQGRVTEINTLQRWSEDPDCRCIIVSGMVGCGKTTLVTEFARKVQDQYNYVFWFSLLETPSLPKLISNYLNIFNQSSEQSSKLEEAPETWELSFLLWEFINCLKQHKVLLVLDGLQSILGRNNSSTYKKCYEEYGWFLRSIISTNHQSLLIATSRLRPKVLEYYSDNQVKMLDLKGFSIDDTKAVINSSNSKPVREEGLLFLSESLQNIPQLLNIVKNHLDDFRDVLDDDQNQVLQDLSLLGAVGELLEQELSYLSDLDREIIYWLAISCSAISLNELTGYTEQSQPKIKFTHSVNFLVKRSLVIKQDHRYSLMPILKAYIRRKLVKQAIQEINS